MVDPTDELKTRAEILHKRLAAGDPAARDRLRALRELRRADDDALAAAAAGVQRKHCLAVVAAELGFTSWDHALRVLRGDPEEADHGTLLNDPATRGIFNAWYADHAEAREHLEERRREGQRAYLLPYRRQFVLVDAFYVEALALDPDDPDWEAIGYDWARPRDPAARTRLLGRRLAALRERP